MQMPRKLKDMNVFEGGQSFLGQCKSFKRPKLSRKFEAWRGAGMDSGVKVDMGASDDLDIEHTYGGDMPELKKKFGAQTLDAVNIRWVGAYQRQDTGAYDRVEIIARGRHEEIDAGDAEAGKDTETKYKTACVYYKESRNGVAEVEIDILGGVYMIHGVDRRAEINAILNS